MIRRTLTVLILSILSTHEVAAKFQPPAANVRPITMQVPENIKQQCINDASAFFGITPELVFTLFDGEGGRIGTFSLNKNGSYDIGPMQINSSNLPEIQDNFPTVTWQVLAYDACASFWGGTWWLYKKIKARDGNVFEGIGDYNSRTPKVRATYIFNFMKRYNVRLQQRGGMTELKHWTPPTIAMNGPHPAQH